MKLLYISLILVGFVASSATAQDATLKEVSAKIEAKEKAPALKSSKRPTTTTTTTKPALTPQVKVYKEAPNQPSLKAGSKPLAPNTSNAKHVAEKKAHLADHPELVQPTKKQQMSRAAYNKLQPSRKAVVDANPQRYEIVD